MCGLITMDILLGKLRQHMAELSVQGDDFTRQMWQMYSAFEDFLEHQNESVEVASAIDDENFLHRSSYPSQQRQRSSSTSAAVFRSYPSQMLVEDPSTTATNATTGGGGSSWAGLSEHSMMVVDDYDLWSTMASVSRDQRTGTDIEDEENYSDIDTNNNSNREDDDDEDETDLIKQGIRNEMERRKLLLRLENAELMMLAAAEQDAATAAEFHDRRRVQYANLPMFSLPLQPPHSPLQQQKSLRRHRHCQKRRRLPATPAYLQFPIKQQQQLNSYPHHHHSHRNHSQFHLYQEFLDDKLTQSTPSVNVGDDDDDVNIEQANNECPQTTPFGDSGIPYRRSSAPELLDNPLLETISTIEDLCESDDYGELPLNKTPAKATRNIDKDMCSSKIISAKSDIVATSSEDRAQQSSDGDRDSVGYAGSNSVDSGYKSSCPTPELLDPCYYAQGAICNGVTLSTASSRRNTQMNKLSREPKQRTITMGTRAIRRQQQQQQCPTRPSPSPSSGRISETSPIAETNSSSVGTGSGSGTSSPSRNSTPAADATSTSGVSTTTGRSPSDYNYYDVNLDHLMYLRQSLLSAIQRCNNGLATDNTTKSKEDDEDDFTLDSQSLAKLAASSKSWSLLDLRSPTPQAATAIERKSSFPHENAADILANIEMKLKNIHSSSMVADDEQLRSSTERINSVASGDNAEYYDLESVKEFPCSYGATNTMENRATRISSIAKVKKLKDSSVEPNLTSFKNCQNVTSKLCSTSSAIDLQQLPSNFECKESNKPMSSSTRSSTKSHHISDPTSDLINTRQQIRDDHRSIVKTSIQQLQQPNQQQQQQQSSQQILQQRQPIQQSQQTMAKLKDEDPSVDKAKFSEVAICMLKIIEDIQHQQQQQNQNSHVEQTNLKKTSPANIQQKQEMTQTRPLSPAIYDSQRLSGADYHLYEEITYDLAIRPLGALLHRDLPKMPPPLPARPNNIFGIQDIRQSCAINHSHNIAPSNSMASLTTSTAEPKHIAATRTEDHGMKLPANRARFHAPRRGNFYTLFAGQGHDGERRHLSRSLERDWWRENRSTTAANQQFDGVDDEYGFKVMIKQPSNRETKT